MVRKTIIACGLLLTTALASAFPLQAAAVSAPPIDAGPNAAAVPAKAKWIIYLNLDQAMKNPAAAKLLAKFLLMRPQAQKGVAALKAMGLKFPQDFHDVLLAGRTVGPNHGVAVLHVTSSQRHLEKFFQSQHAAITVTQLAGGIDKIVDKKGHTFYEASPASDTFVASRAQSSLRRELRVLAGKSASMAAGNPLLAGAHPRGILFLADTELANLPNRGGRRGPHWLKSVTSGRLAAWVTKGRLKVSARINLKSPDTAAQSVQIAQAWQAAMDLGATNAHTNPRQRFIAGIADRLNVGAIGKAIHIHWSMPLAKLLAGPKSQPSATQ